MRRACCCAIHSFVHRAHEELCVSRCSHAWLGIISSAMDGNLDQTMKNPIDATTVIEVMGLIISIGTLAILAIAWWVFLLSGQELNTNAIMTLAVIGWFISAVQFAKRLL